MKYNKALILTLPRLEPHRPPVSTAIIGAVCRKYVGEVYSLDLNIDLYHYDKNLFNCLDAILDGYRQPSLAEEQSINSFINSNINKIHSIDPDIILISVFSYTTHYFTKLILQKLRNIRAIKIIGGQGVYVPELSRQEDERNLFGETMLAKGLIDHYVVGEGEEVIASFLQGKESLPGLDNTNKSQIMDLNAAAWPDYSFFDLDRYEYLNDEREVFITGSRGCVRKCTYCDVPYHWPKFRWRDGSNIAQEMISHYENHGVTRFYFTDSLINGSLKAFNDMCSRLAAYKFDKKIKWGGQFICKPRNQISNEYFDMMAAAGADQFYIGIETGSDRVRWSMDKKFTNDDIDYHLEHFSRTRLGMFFLMLVGYVTETSEDHLDTMSMFPRWQRYVADGTIRGIDLGPTLIVLANTPLDSMREELGIKFVNGDPKSWVADCNPDLTIKERIRRRLQVHKQAIDYCWPIWRGPSRLMVLKDLITGVTGDMQGKYQLNGNLDR
jgi:Radical SAM superfamily